MTFEEARRSYSESTPEVQAMILVRYAHFLTIRARDAYEPRKEGVRDPASLRRVNEAMHRITSHVCSLLRKESRRYPDDVLLGIIIGSQGPMQSESAFADAVGDVSLE